MKSLDELLSMDPEDRAEYLHNESLKTHTRSKYESFIALNPRWAYEYAVYVLEDRFPEGEKTIAQHPWFAYYYALHIIHGKFPEGEPAIIKDPFVLDLYLLNVLHNPIDERWLHLNI